MYMAVTADKYELPLAVADTAKELARMVGTTTDSIYSSVYRKRSGKGKGIKYVKVDWRESDESI